MIRTREEFDQLDPAQQDKLVRNHFAGLIMDGVRKANSGHTGGALSSLDFVYSLYRNHLRFDPDDPYWFGRDRFVLSAGHESMLLYSMLYGIGYLTLDDLRAFRQLNSRTPGHPEQGHTPGVEATTGPLGQGISMAVGMALAPQIIGAKIQSDLMNSRTWVLASDGDLQEPVALGSAQLAALYGLDNLIVFYDSNKIQISGDTRRNDRTDIPAVFRAFGWNVLEIDGNDSAAIEGAIEVAKAHRGSPTIIVGNTCMANGCASMAGSEATHGAPLPPEEIAATKLAMGLDPEVDFAFPQWVRDAFCWRFEDLRSQSDHWYERMEAETYNDWVIRDLIQTLRGAPLPDFVVAGDWDNATVSTRKVFGKALASAAQECSFIVGGSADLEPSNNTTDFMKRSGDYSVDNKRGHSLPFGVREFPMGSIANGLQLWGVRAFTATFLTFSDYMRSAIRTAALQSRSPMFVFTHDSIALGEDGPTHQPIEHLESLRLIPRVQVMRPADARETIEAVRYGFNTRQPTVLCLTRQDVPPLTAEHYNSGARFELGAFVLRPETADLRLCVVATGSEVSLAMQAVERLEAETGMGIRVVNMPCRELFEKQQDSYREQVLPADVPCAVIEAGATGGWYKYAGRDGLVIGIDRFGASAPAADLAEYFGLTVDAVCERLRTVLQ